MTLQDISARLNQTIQKQLNAGDAYALMGRPYILERRLSELLVQSSEAKAAKLKHGLSLDVGVEALSLLVVGQVTESNPYSVLKSKGNYIDRTIFTVKRKKMRNIGEQGLTGLVANEVTFAPDINPELTVEQFYGELAAQVAKRNQALIKAVQTIDEAICALGADRMYDLIQAISMTKSQSNLNFLQEKWEIVWGESLLNEELRAKIIKLSR